MSHSVVDSPPPLGEQSGCPKPEQHPDTGDTLLTDIRQVAITTIRVIDLTLGLRRIPAGFYVKVLADDVQWQTANKPVHVDLDVLEWNERIVLPPEASCRVQFSVYATFELDPILGHGDLLRTFEISVADLVNCSKNSLPVIFQPKAGELVSPCTELFIKVEQLLSCETDIDGLHPITISTPYDMHELISTTDAGHYTLARYHRTQDNTDLDQSIAHFERSLDLCPIDHPCRPAAMVNLAIAKLISCQVNGTYLDLDIPISFFLDALDLRSTGHPDRLATQLHLVMALVFRFTKRGCQTDADTATELLNEVLNDAKSSIYLEALLAIETSVLHPARNTNLHNFCAERPISSVLPLSVNELSRQAELCEQSDDLNALDEVISLHYDALKYCSTAHHARSMLLCNLGVILQKRFGRRGDVKDLDEAIAHLRDAQILQPVGHPRRDSSLISLASVLSTRFEHRGNDKDLDEAIMLYREALPLQPVGHPHRDSSWINLASALLTRFRHRGNDKDLDEAIMFHRAAQILWPVDHPNRDSVMNNLANALSTRFEHRGHDKDLDEAIALHREAQTLRPVGHPHRDSSLNNLASDLSTRFNHRGDGKDLDEAIVLRREALTLRPVGHPHRDLSLNILAIALSTCFDHRGHDKDLDEAIELHREAQTLRPIGHPDRPLSLNNLANVLSTRFRHRGNDKDLDEAIALHREAQILWPVGHPHRYSSLDNLATVLSTRFDHRGHDKDLGEAIALHREAQTLRPVGHPHRDSSLNNLASALLTRFRHRGNDKDLDEAIALHRETQTLRPVGHSRWGLSLTHLATALTTRFEHRGHDKDLEEAIVLHREAQTLRPVGHPDRPLLLNNFAVALLTRFQHQGIDKDLDEAIALHRESQTLQPVSHPHRDLSLDNLAGALLDRFRSQLGGNDQDLDEAIALHREVQTLRPNSHPDWYWSLNNLARALWTRFEYRGNDKDLDNALANTRSALTQLTKHHPHHSYINESLASIYLSLHQLSLNGTSNDNLNTAIHHVKAAVDTVSGSLLSRLRTSLVWVSTADQYTHSTLLEAYTTSIQLLDAYMSMTASVSSRHHVMKAFPTTLAVDAASCALQCGEVCRAVELLEQGRTLIWTQMARFRTPLDSLLECGDHNTQALAKKFREISSLLDKPPAELPEGTTKAKEEAEAARYSRLVDEWNSTVQEIRKVEGFSRFMLPPLFSDLQDAARDGPIIILIASKSFCDAIVIVHQHSPIRVQLRSSLERLGCLVTTLQQTVQVGPQGKQGRQSVKTEPEIVPQEKQTRLIEVLRELWADVVCPVVENLARFVQPGSRIWWCPTLSFNFLPLHAAGEYRRGGRNLSQLYVSSYTPSLTALIRARRSHDKSLPIPFAAIGQDFPEGASFSLPCVEPELELVRSLLPLAPTVSFTKVTSIESTKSKALRTLRDNRWLHFACHGTQNFDEAFKSAFLMRDQPLTLLDIIQTDLSQHEFAFLSACETAVGDLQTADEVIHLAAGLQFGGVKSVIGTFWSVTDHTVQRLVEEFYKNFCGDGKMNSRRAAGALRKAVQLLANDKDIALDQRIVFMHIGL